MILEILLRFVKHHSFPAFGFQQLLFDSTAPITRQQVTFVQGLPHPSTDFFTCVSASAKLVVWIDG